MLSSFAVRPLEARVVLAKEVAVEQDMETAGHGGGEAEATLAIERQKLRGPGRQNQAANERFRSESRHTSRAACD